MGGAYTCQQCKGNKKEVAAQEKAVSAGERRKSSEWRNPGATKLKNYKAALEKFELFDLDKNGTIERSELGQVLQELDARRWTNTRLDQLFAAVDVSGDGTLQYEEFLDWVFAANDDD